MGGDLNVDDGERLATFARSTGENIRELRVSWSRYEGRPFLSLRIWRQDVRSGWWPTKAGVTVRACEIDEFGRAVVKALCYAAGGVKPRRIQSLHVKGWRKPIGAVIVARPTRWGNPFTAEETGSRANAVAQFRAHIEAHPDLAADARRELRGRDLCCWCRLDEPCHADVWLEVANREESA